MRPAGTVIVVVAPGIVFHVPPSVLNGVVDRTIRTWSTAPPVMLVAPVVRCAAPAAIPTAPTVVPSATAANAIHRFEPT